MAKRTWFTMAAVDEGALSADVAIYDYIGWYGVEAAAFRDALAALPSTVATINLRINSPGGDVYQGVTIHNMLARHPADVIVTVDGMAASIASLIAMSGKQILMPENSAMLIHNPSGGVWGTAEDMDQMAGWLRSIGQGVTNTYVSANRVGLPRADIEAMLASETWMTAEEAVAKGFADKVVAPSEVTMRFDPEEAGFEKMPTLLARRPPPAAKWVATPEAAINRYRTDEVAEFAAAAASTAALDACGFKAGATPEPAKARAGFLFVNETAPNVPESYRFPLVTMADGQMLVTAAALDAAAASLEAATDIDDAEKLIAGATIAQHRQAIATLKANNVDTAAGAALRVTAAAEATRSKEILAACELAGVTAKVAREFVDGGKSLDQVKALLLAGGSGGTDRDPINAHVPASGGHTDPDPSAGWTKAVDRLNATRKPRVHA